MGPEIVKTCECDMCKRAIAEHFSLETAQVKELLKHYLLRERKIAAGISPHPKAVRGRITKEYMITPSTSRGGSCYDNAMAKISSPF